MGSARPRTAHIPNHRRPNRRRPKEITILFVFLFAVCGPLFADDPNPKPGGPPYTVSFNANGGSPAPAPQTVAAGAKPTQPAFMTKAASGCAGWYREPGLSGAPWNFALDTVSGDMTLYAKWEKAADDVNKIKDYIAAIGGQKDGDSVENPLPLMVSIDLGVMTESGSGWEKLLAALEAAGKYVALDLSPCALGGGEFNPAAASAGKDKIAGLILPGAAEKIAAGVIAGDESIPAFKGFDNLANVEGAHITGIGYKAFAHCYRLRSVSFPAARSVGGLAFDSCAGLESAGFGEARVIGKAAFYNTGLISVSLPKARVIGDMAFADCGMLRSVSLPEARVIGGSAFSACSGLRSVSLPAARSVGNNAFSHCISLESASLPAVRRLDDKTFAYCGRLRSVSLPEARVIGEAAFSHSGLQSVSLPKALTIGTEAFSSCAGLTSVSLPAARDIGDHAFFQCTALQSVSLPAALNIGRAAFNVCTGLTSVSLEAAEDVGDHAFYSCPGLKSVSLKAARSIGEAAFGNCAGLRSLGLGQNAPGLGKNLFYLISSAQIITVNVPSGATGYDEAWKAAFKGKGSDNNGTENTFITVSVVAGK